MLGNFHNTIVPGISRRQAVVKARIGPVTSLLLTVVLAGSLALGSCGDEFPPLSTTMLSITSDPQPDGLRLDGIQFLATDGTTRFPAAAAFDTSYLVLSETTDPATTPVFMGVDYAGTTFKTSKVQVKLTGMRNGSAVAGWIGTIDIGPNEVVKVHLTNIGANCDVDNDGFADCSIAGCCAEGEAFSDCEPNIATANPWGTEPACEPCADKVDQDCNGGDQKCLDLDNDGIEDCREVLEDCGQDNSKVGPGFPELCDNIDNNCDGQTDEGLLSKLNLPLGAGCGLLGICSTGKIVCNPTDATVAPVCNKIPLPEICGNALDEDCNGKVEECITNDADGDGSVTADDCNDADRAFYPGAPLEPCCSFVLSDGEDPQAPSASVLIVCDNNCDGTVSFCNADDTDGDGYGVDSDCDDSDETINPGAPELCGDGVDQDCFGGDLPCALITDEDGDGYAAEVDCNDESNLIHPNAEELCDGVDNDCDGVVDGGNPGGGVPCGLDKGQCSPGTTVCGKEGGVHGLVCPDDIEAQPERCDALDHDCNDQPHNGLLYVAGDSAPSAVGTACNGIAACGAGVVECGPLDTAICSTDPGGSDQIVGVAELCDGIDNDCDGEIDEGLGVEQSDCQLVGVCGTHQGLIIAECKGGKWQCDYSAVPGFELGKEVSCDGLDNDCDEVVDEDFSVGSGCDGDDEDECLNGTVQCNNDGSNTTYCSETGFSVESCDGVDNDCDGLIDEDFTTLGDTCDGPDADKCKDGLIVCALNLSGTECLETAPPKVELCDGQDNDCDGVVDNGFPVGQPCDGLDSDQCLNGTYTCAPGGGSVECTNETVVNLVELCDAIDNNCDGVINEGIDPNFGQPCDGPDDDACAEGVLVCGPGGSLTDFVCSDDTSDSVELCNGLDDDCDGLVDNGVVADAATGGCLTAGVCAGSQAQIVANCDEGGTGTWICDYSAVPSFGVEQCDTLDHDCDGMVAETFVDSDGDATADCIDTDIDGDGLLNDVGGAVTTPCMGGETNGCQDNCPYLDNSLQFDADNDGEGDGCDLDKDGDGTPNVSDNCPDLYNPEQDDTSGNGIGDACTVQTCTPHDTRCSDDRTVQTCNSVGDAEIPSECSYMCENDTCVVPTGVAANLIASCGPSNAGSFPSNWVSGYVSGTSISLCTSGGSCTTVSAIQNSTSTSVPVVFCLTSMTVGSGRTIYASSSSPPPGPVVFLVDGNVNIVGTVNFSGGPGQGSTGGVAGPGGWRGGNRADNDQDGPDGEGAGGGYGGKGETSFHYDGGGGGGGGFGGSGAKGGDGDNGAGGAGGSTYGQVGLFPLVGGSGGASGGDGYWETDAGPGGGGAGAVHIVSRGTIFVATGTIAVRGGKGRNASDRQGGGGGGSGGSILLEARVLSLVANKLDVRGGAGGNAKAGNGGAGAGASGVNGSVGAGSSSNGKGGAGGGGGAGRVRLNTPGGGASCTASYPTQACSAGALGTP